MSKMFYETLSSYNKEHFGRHYNTRAETERFTKCILKKTHQEGITSQDIYGKNIERLLSTQDIMYAVKT